MIGYPNFTPRINDWERRWALSKKVLFWTKDGRLRPRQCNQYEHAKGCRPGRPLCRWMRRVRADKRGVCDCPAYHFPHRRGSGLCGHPERFWEDYSKWLEAHESEDKIPF
jgi:hypothetical protein